MATEDTSTLQVYTITYEDITRTCVATSPGDLVDYFMERYVPEGNQPIRLQFQLLSDSTIEFTDRTLELIVGQYSDREPKTRVSVPIPPQSRGFDDRPATREASGRPSGEHPAVTGKR